MSQFQLIDQTPGPDPKRIILAVVAMSALLMVHSYFFSPAKETKEAVLERAPEKELKENEVVAGRHKKATPENLPEIKKEFFIKNGSDKLERTSYLATVSNTGGMIDHLVLTDFSREKVLFDRNQKSILLALSSKSAEDHLNENSKYELVSSDEKNISFSHITPSGLKIDRNYEFLKQDVIKETILVKNLGEKPRRVELSLLLSKHQAIQKDGSFLSGPAPVNNVSLKSYTEFNKYAFKDLVEEKVWSPVHYIGFDDQYFLSVFIPEKEEDIKLIRAKVNADHGETANIEIELSPQVLLSQEEKLFEHKIFAGPKQIDLLSHMTPSLAENVDFGWLSALCRPMLWLLVKIYEQVGNFGLAIILITILIKLLTHPLTRKSYSSQAEMKKIAPKIQELSKKYGHDRALLGQKQMELYREHGINPMAGCLPLLIQLPIWFAFYRMLGFSVELYDQPFIGWIHDLTSPDPYYVLPLFMGGTMLITQALTPMQLDNQPQMKYVLWIMPIFFTFIMLNMPAGLSLYILTNNLLTIAQQIIIKKKA